MKGLLIDWSNAGISTSGLARYQDMLKDEISIMRDARGSMYSDERASINLPLDEEHLRLSLQLARQHAGAELLVVVGIGGSNLGTWAVQDAILGKLHNMSGRTPRILYADTNDTDTINTINSILADTLKRKKHAVVNVVCKSGTTTETIANFQVLLATLKRHGKSPARHVVITTDAGSALWHLARDEGFSLLPIPENVGGRYSVFSPVGLFPLALLGIDVRKLLAGAAHMRAKCLSSGENPAVIRAAMIHNAHTQGRNIADNFYFRPDFESIGKWYRQLMGESLGKEWNRSHKKQVWTGITPTVSVGTFDLHSMAQLYFGGPRDKFHTIVTLKRPNTSRMVRGTLRYDALVHNIQGKQLHDIMDAVVKGVATVMRNQDRPYCIIQLERADEESVGALLQLHMMEMMYLGALFDVNPFDQPNVEAYKVETKRALAKKR